MDLSIIILNYNTKNLLRKCLKSVFKSETSFKLEIIVVDNGSRDGSLDLVRAEFPQVKIVENNANFGFSKGNNQALKIVAGRYYLLLNSDTEVRPDTFDLCIKKMDSDPKIGILGCKVLLPDGSLHEACRRRFPNPANAFLRLFGLRKFSNYNYQNIPVDQETEVDSVTGAYLMIRRTVVDRVGLLDEQFFMYGEDLDWCWRVKEAGFKVLYYPATQITHYLYGSSKFVKFHSVQWAHDAMKIFYHKHYASDHNWLFNWLVYFGINLRMFLVIFVNLFRANKSVH